MFEREKFNEKMYYFLENSLALDGDLIELDTELFSEEIGLGSIDALEIIAFVDMEYGVNMTGVPKENFATINAIANYVESQYVKKD